ncbi:MAG TPA: hypothetical protein VJV04_13150 [Nitrospiraceae bacterium]|nr:hypothetical protein [Nitrospiraceae bacterium]
MKYMIVLCLVSGSLFLTHLSQGQTGADALTQREEPGALGGFSPDLLSKIRALALILQKKMADGQITGGTLQQELQGGDASAVIRGLGPDANRLLEEIKASLQSSYSEESLSLLLQALTGAVP